MKSSERRRGSAVFRPRARVIRTLGRDLITNEFVAIQELVKNAYDADATKVAIRFEEPLVPGQGAVAISDNGHGMTLDTVLGAWMEPATAEKSERTVTKRGRRVTGAKGIGRFAAARVGTALELSSIAKRSGREVHIRFDWGAFDDDSLYLDEVKVRWEVVDVPKAAPSGTVLRLMNLRDDWSRQSEPSPFHVLRGELSRLVSPLVPSKEFEIELELPDRYRESAGLIQSPAILGRPHYRLKGEIDANGVIRAVYDGPDGKRTIPSTGATKAVKLAGGLKPTCGPFSFEFRVWDREEADLRPLVSELGSTLRNLRKDLDAASGVSIYRDGFRVLLPQSDWLRLDIRRVQNPTLRLSNNQIVATASISADDNPRLTDQTNRQGIVDSPAFEDFKASLMEVLAILEVERSNARRQREKHKDERGIFQRLDFAPTREYLEKRYPDDKKLKTFLEKQSREFERGIGDVQEVISRYRRLATMGQLIDVVLHDGRTPVATISNEVELARKDGKKLEPIDFKTRVLERLELVMRQAEALTGLFRRIAPFSGRKRGRPSETTMERIIADAFAVYEKRLQELKVQIDLPQGATPVTVDVAEVEGIIVNLLDNSIYWLEKVDEDRRRIAVQCRRRPEELQVTFSDSGPGVPEEIQDRIFEPYFSSKPDGVGLGLTIAGETAAEYDGGLELLADGPLEGATFRLRLRRRIGDGEDA